MPIEKMTDEKTQPLQGGSNTRKEKSALELGQLSMVQNLRGRHPGFKKRKGEKKLNLTSVGDYEIKSIYQFEKSRVTESHTYAQIQFPTYDHVVEFTNDPPTQATGALYTATSFSGTGTSIAASWGNLGDKLIYSNGLTQHQIYAGDSSYTDKFIVYRGTDLPLIPVNGEDYSIEVSDEQTDTYAQAGSLSTLAAFDCIYILAPVPIDQLYWTLGDTHDSTTTGQVHYWDGSAWTTVSGFADGTSVSGVTLGQSGAMTWTAPTDIKPKYQYSVNGFWYRWSIATGANLDSSVTVTSLTFDCNWQSIINLWDGLPQDGVEVQIFDASENNYLLYGATSVDIDETTTSDKVYVATTDPIIGLYIDPGATPNASGTTINAVKYWDGDSWEDVTSLNDDTGGASKPGWVTWERQSDVQPLQFQGTQYYAYWYYFTFSATTAASTNIGIQYMPYFDIDDFGKSQTNAVWKDRSVYSFDRWGAYLYFSKRNAPMVLNGIDYGILKVGDGRNNLVVASRKFHNEFMVWQEEKGVEGGCITLVEGYSPVTFGKLLLSARIGSMNNKSVVVVDGVLTSTSTDESIKTVAYFLSREGIFACDGRVVWAISDDIQNYFDPQETECIRRGYESKMWVSHDTAERVLRIGLVSGANATECNIFPVYDLVDGSWYFDTLGKPIACMTEVTAGSGDVIVIQVGGGSDDGFVYQLNYGLNDVGEAIDSFIQMELSGNGDKLLLRELNPTFKAESTGTAYIELFDAGRPRFKKNIKMTAAVWNQFVRHHRIHYKHVSRHISIKIGNNEPHRDFYIQEVGPQLYRIRRQ